MTTRIFQGKLVEETDIGIVLRPGEISVDTNTGLLYIHDGTTPGGKPILQGAVGPTGPQGPVGPQGPAGQQGSQGQGGSGGTGTNYGIVTSSTEIVITTDYLGQQSGLLGHILNIPLNTLNQEIQSGWTVLFADGQTTATVGSAYTNGDHITLNLNVPGGSIFVQPAYPITVIGTTTLGATATNVVIPGFGLVLNSDGTLSVNSATIQGLLPVFEISGNPGITTIDNNLQVMGVVAATAVTVSNFISFPDGTVQTTAALSGSLGFGLQRNGDGTISVNSTTIQTLLPILEIAQNSTSTTVIDNNTIIQGVLGAHALTVTNAIYFPDGTVQTTAGGGSGGTGNGWELTSSTQIVSLDSNGTLHTPLMFPKVFTATLVPVRHSGDAGAPAWDFEIHFVPGQDGELVTQINNPVRFNNPGYQSGDSYTFTEADHGILGYNFTITLNNVSQHEAGWTANLAVSPPPAYPETIKSSGAFKLSTGTKNWIFGTGGRLTLPTTVTGIPTAITLVNGGTEMVGYTNATYPTYVNSGSGHGMTVDVLSNGTSISQVTINQPGSGYNVGDHVFVDGGTGTGEFTVDSVISYPGGIVFPDGTLQTTAGALIIQSDTQPTGTTSTLWYDTVGGRSYVYFDNSWVDASPIATASATTSTLVNGSYHFTLGVDGTINFDPATNGKGVLQTTADIWFNANGAIYNFGADGSLTFPDNTHQTTAYPGTKIGGAVNIGTTSSNIFIPNTNTQALGLINSLAGVYIEAGTPQKVWQFNTDGTLTLPGSLTGDSVSIQGAPVTITITDNSGLVWGGALGTYTRLNGITPPKWAPANYNPGSDSSITYDGGWQLNNPNFGHPVYVNTGSLTNPSATWDPDVQFGLGSGNPAGAYSYNNWTFGTDGSFTAPGPIYGGVNTIGLATPAPLNLNNTGPVGQVKTQLNLINTAGNAGTGSAIDYFTYVDQGNGLPGARLQAVDDNAYSANFSIALKGKGNTGNNGLTTVWTFGSDGTLTFPDTTVQTTAFTASSYISKATLQSIISTCTSFTEFKNAILGL